MCEIVGGRTGRRYKVFFQVLSKKKNYGVEVIKVQMLQCHPPPSHLLLYTGVVEVVRQPLTPINLKVEIFKILLREKKYEFG